jgi:chromosome segregation ATPase
LQKKDLEHKKKLTDAETGYKNKLEEKDGAYKTQLASELKKQEKLLKETYVSLLNEAKTEYEKIINVKQTSIEKLDSVKATLEYQNQELEQKLKETEKLIGEVDKDWPELIEQDYREDELIEKLGEAQEKYQRLTKEQDEDWQKKYNELEDSNFALMRAAEFEKLEQQEHIEKSDAKWTNLDTSVHLLASELSDEDKKLAEDGKYIDVLSHATPQFQSLKADKTAKEKYENAIKQLLTGEVGPETKVNYFEILKKTKEKFESVQELEQKLKIAEDENKKLKDTASQAGDLQARCEESENKREIAEQQIEELQNKCDVLEDWAYKRELEQKLKEAEAKPALSAEEKKAYETKIEEQTKLIGAQKEELVKAGEEKTTLEQMLTNLAVKAGGTADYNKAMDKVNGIAIDMAGYEAIFRMAGLKNHKELRDRIAQNNSFCQDLSNIVSVPITELSTLETQVKKKLSQCKNYDGAMSAMRQVVGAKKDIDFAAWTELVLAPIINCYCESQQLSGADVAPQGVVGWLNSILEKLDEQNIFEQLLVATQEQNEELVDWANRIIAEQGNYKTYKPIIERLPPSDQKELISLITYFANRAEQVGAKNVQQFKQQLEQQTTDARIYRTFAAIVGVKNPRDFQPIADALTELKNRYHPRTPEDFAEIIKSLTSVRKSDKITYEKTTPSEGLKKK